MFESIKGINSVTRRQIICCLKNIRSKEEDFVFFEMERYLAYISALRDMKIISFSEESFLWEVGRYMECKYSYHCDWDRKRIRELIKK